MNDALNTLADLTRRAERTGDALASIGTTIRLMADRVRDRRSPEAIARAERLRAALNAALDEYR